MWFCACRGSSPLLQFVVRCCDVTKRLAETVAAELPLERADATPNQQAPIKPGNRNIRAPNTEARHDKSNTVSDMVVC